MPLAINCFCTSGSEWEAFVTCLRRSSLHCSCFWDGTWYLSPPWSICLDCFGQDSDVLQMDGWFFWMIEMDTLLHPGLSWLSVYMLPHLQGMLHMPGMRRARSSLMCRRKLQTFLDGWHTILMLCLDYIVPMRLKLVPTKGRRVTEGVSCLSGGTILHGLLPTHKTTQYHNPQDHNLQLHRQKT